MYENQNYYDIFVIHKEVVSLQTCDLKYEIETFAYMFIMKVQVITILGCFVRIIFNTVVTCITIISGIICHPILVFVCIIFEFYEHSSIKMIAALSILPMYWYEHTWKKTVSYMYLCMLKWCKNASVKQHASFLSAYLYIISLYVALASCVPVCSNKCSSCKGLWTHNFSSK